MKRQAEGSYTVEAAFVVPVVLGMAFVILYTLFLQHDKVMLQANLDNLIFLMAEDCEDYRQEYQAYLQESLWCMKIKKAEVSSGIIKICASIEAEAVWEIPLLSYFIDGKQKITIKEDYCKIHPEEVLRYGKDFIDKKEGAYGGKD